MSTPFDRRLVAAGLALALAAAGAVAQEPVPPQEPEPPAPVEEIPPPDGGADAEAEVRAREALDEALEEVEQELDEDLRSSRIAVQDRRERIREVREQVRRKLAEARTRSDSKVSFGSSVHIREDEVARDVVVIGGSIKIDGDLYGDAVAVGGSIEVDGKVTGDLVAVGGGIELQNDAQVLGEVTAVGGVVDQHEDAEVLGRVNEVSVGSSFMTFDIGDWGRWSDWDSRREWDWSDRPRRWGWGFGPWVEIGWELSFLVMLALLVCLVQLVGGHTVARVRDKVVEAPWVAGLVGLAIQLLFVPVLVVVILILTLSIVGIPLLLLIPFVLLAFLLAWLVGYTGFAMAVGRWFEARFDRSFTSPFVALLVGVAIIQSLSFIGEIFDALPGFLWIFAVMFGILGFVLQYAAWTIGIGAVFLNGFRRQATASASPAPPPPPAPAGDQLVAPEPGIPPQDPEPVREPDQAPRADASEPRSAPDDPAEDRRPDGGP